MRPTRRSTPPRIDRLDLGRRSDRRRFIDLQGAVYRHDSSFMRPLRRDQHWLLNPQRSPVHQDLELCALMAHRGDRPAGRLIVHRNRSYDRTHGAGTGWFGFFECVDDPEVAEALFEEGVAWLEGLGTTEILGPANFTTQYQAGLLVDSGGQAVGPSAIHSPPRYLEMLGGLGFEGAQDRLSWRWDLNQAMRCPRLGRLAEEAERNKGQLAVRPVDMRRLEQELEPWHAIVNAAAHDTDGLAPMSEAEFDALAFDIARVARQGLVLFAEADGRPVAYSVLVPDLDELLPANGRLLPLGWVRLVRGRCRVRKARLLRLEVLPGFRDRGIENLLLMETARRAWAAGFQEAEIGGVWDSQHSMIQAMRGLRLRVDRRHRLMRRKLRRP